MPRHAHEVGNNFIVAQAKAATGARLAATGATSAATGARPQFLGVRLIHVQDEADIRLLSDDANRGNGLPRRSITSQVQVHVAQLVVRDRSWAFPMELEALANNTVRTLAA